jgi:hypothetical protein
VHRALPGLVASCVCLLERALEFATSSSASPPPALLRQLRALDTRKRVAALAEALQKPQTFPPSPVRVTDHQSAPAQPVPKVSKSGTGTMKSMRTVKDCKALSEPAAKAATRAAVASRSPRRTGAGGAAMAGGGVGADWCKSFSVIRYVCPPCLAAKAGGKATALASSVAPSSTAARTAASLIRAAACCESQIGNGGLDPLIRTHAELGAEVPHTAQLVGAAVAPASPLNVRSRPTAKVDAACAA